MQFLLKNRRILFVGILALALFVRLLGIASRPLWYDEAFSVLFSEKGPAAMLVGTLSPTPMGAADVHPLAYYTLLWIWMRVFSESPIAVRTLSIIAGLGVVTLVYILALELFDVRTALAAGVIAALSPFQVHFAQEIRMYVFMCLWLLLTTFAYHRAVQSGRWIWWPCFAIFAALAQYSHNLAAFYLIAVALWPLLIKNWRALKGVVLAGSLAILLYLPWLIHLPAQFAKVDQSYWIVKPGLYRLFTLLLIFVVNLPLPNSWLALGLFITLFIFAIAIWQTIRAASEKPADIRNGFWMLYLAFFPPVFLFLFSQWKPVYLERALLPSGAIFCIWIAWTLVDVKMPSAGTFLASALLLIGFSMGIYQHVTFTGLLYGPYQALMENLESRRQAGDVIVHSSKLSMLPSVYYDRNLPQTYLADAPGSSVDTLALSTQQVLGLVAKADIYSAVSNVPRVWFVIFDESNQEYIQAGYPRNPQLTALMEHYTQVEEEEWGTLHLYLFSRNQ